MTKCSLPTALTKKRVMAITADETANIVQFGEHAIGGEYQWTTCALGFSLSADHFGIPIANFKNASAAGMDMRSYARLLTSPALKRIADGK